MMPSFTKRNQTIWLAVLVSIVCIPLLAYGVSQGYFKLVLAGIIGLACLGVTLINPIAGMYLLTFFLPFERIGSVDVSGLTIRISQVLAITTVIAWIGRGLIWQRFKLRAYPIIIPIGLFIAINIFSLANSPNFERSVLVLGFIVFTIVVSLMIPNVIRHRAQVERVVSILLISATVVSLFGIFQFLGDYFGLPTSLTGLRPQYTKAILGFPRVQATALEPLYYANYLLIPLGLTLCLWMSRASQIKNYLLLGIILLTGLNLFLTVSRGGYIAFGVMVLFIGLIYYRALLRPRTLLGGIAVVGLVVLLAFRFLNIGEQWSNFAEHVTNIFGGASYAERVETFSIAETIWWQHPWIGIGPGGFGPYAAYHPLITPSEGYKIVNNEYIELLAETGILGLACFIVMIMILLVRSIKAWRAAKQDDYLRAVLVALTATLIAVLVQYNTFSILYITHIWFTMGLLITVQNIILHGDKQ